MIRLDRFLANAQIGSRSQVKKGILSGLVEVNGLLVTKVDYHVDPDTDQVTYDGAAVQAHHLVYVMLNKPIRCVCGRRSEGAYPSVFSWIEHPYGHEFSVAGRLDADATGLLLISNDGQWIHRIISPRSHVPKIYLVEIAGYDPDWERLFREGICIDQEEKCLPVTEFQLLESVQEGVYRVKLGIVEGKYHQVKRMFAAVGSRVLTIHRVKIGSVELDPQLEPGKWRFLSSTEQISVLEPG